MLSDSQILPNATSVDSTNMAYVGGQTGGKLRIAVYAAEAIAIATGQAFNIELQTFSSDTAASAISPFSNANKGAQAAGTSGTSHDVAHMYLLHKTSGDDAIAYTKGDLIVDIGLPEPMMALLGHDYVQLVYTTDADESGSNEDVDAFIYESG